MLVARASRPPANERGVSLSIRNHVPWRSVQVTARLASNAGARVPTLHRPRPWAAERKLRRSASSRKKIIDDMTILAARSVSNFFSDAVVDSIRSRRIEATDDATRYLVCLLTDFAHPDQRAGEALDRPLTLLLDEAVRAPDPGERFDRLRSLGDGVLYGCGFFSDHFEARGIDPGYLHSLGTRAYQNASAMMPRHRAAVDLFAELARNFAAFVAILSDIADMTVALGTETAGGLVKAYERWLKTGSERLASALTARGVLPIRGGTGMVQ